MSVPRFGVSWFFRLHVEASAHGSSGPPVLPVGSLVLWSSWLIGCGHRIIRSIAAKKTIIVLPFGAPSLKIAVVHWRPAVFFLVALRSSRFKV